jgi:hypothetical protein
MKMIRLKIQIFPALLILIYSSLAILGCSKEKKQEHETEDLEKAAQSSSSVINDTLKKNPNGLKDLEALQGIVYVSRAYSSPHLALESESGKVYLITGKRQRELSNLRNRKVTVWGYVYNDTSNIQGTRDTVEVLRYEVIGGEGG